MTVDTFQPDPLGGAVAPPVFSASGTSAALEQLAQWVTAAQNAHQLVAPLVDTPFVPDSYRPKVDPRATDEEKQRAYAVAVATGTAAVLQGLSLGLDPLTSLQQIYVVHGRPGMYARIKVALVTSRGHEVWTEDLTDTRAVVCGRRKGSQNTERVVITMDMAKKAGWTSNNTYTKTPQDMLYARAAGRVCDRIAPDVLMGIASVEDITDEASVDAQPARTRTVKRAEVAGGERPALPAEQAPRPAPRATAEPEQRPQPSGPPLPGEDESPAGADRGLVTDPQLRKLGALFSQLGIKGAGERADRLTIASKVANRPLTTSKELTLDEAKTLIDTLESIASLPQADGDLAIDDMLGRRPEVADPDGQRAYEQAEGGAEDDDYDDAMGGAEAEAEADRG